MITLSVKYRPKTFEDVVEQSSIVKVLSKQVETHTFRNAYLFCGASGCGKTTVARILSNAINGKDGCAIEIDAASNNGVDNMRLIVNSAQERSLDSEYKIIILDECHALTNQSWQALLKCIEEPPEYTIFILCTTDPQKIPDTILNRVQRFNFTRISPNSIKERLKYVCRCEGFTNYDETVEYISKICNGGMRDALSLLDKVSSLDTSMCIENTLNVLGNYSYDTFFTLINAIIDGNEKVVLNIIQDMHNSGKNLKLFVDTFLEFTLDISKYILFESTDMITIPASMVPQIKGCINFNNAKDYYRYIVNNLWDIKNIIKGESNIKVLIDIAFMKMCNVG